MKSLLIITLLAACAAGCTSVHRLDSTKFEVIPVPQGMQDPAKFEDMSKRMSEGKPVILKVAQGERMPFKLTMNLPMGTLEKSDYTFVYTHDTYFLMSRKAFRISADGQRWANVWNPGAVSKLFGCQHGEFSFGFNSSTNEPPFMNVEIKAK